jgi:hypothetical protein
VLANGVALTLLGSPGFWNYQPAGATYGQITSTFTADTTSTTISIVGHIFGSTQFMMLV